MAYADNTISDGDGLTPVANQNMSFGSVSCATGNVEVGPGRDLAQWQCRLDECLQGRLDRHGVGAVGDRRRSERFGCCALHADDDARELGAMLSNNTLSSAVTCNGERQLEHARGGDGYRYLFEHKGSTPTMTRSRARMT